MPDCLQRNRNEKELEFKRQRNEEESVQADDEVGSRQQTPEGLHSMGSMVCVCVDELFVLKLAYKSNLNDRLLSVYFENCGR